MYQLSLKVINSRARKGQQSYKLPAECDNELRHPSFFIVVPFVYIHVLAIITNTLLRFVYHIIS